MYASPQIEMAHEEALDNASSQLQFSGFIVADVILTGSAAYGKADPRDYDVGVRLIGADHAAVIQWAAATGWEPCGRMYCDADRLIYRKGETNLFVFLNYQSWERFVAATYMVQHLVKRGFLSGEDKDEYVKVFQRLRGEL